MMEDCTRKDAVFFIFRFKTSAYAGVFSFLGPSWSPHVGSRLAFEFGVGHGERGRTGHSSCGRWCGKIRSASCCVRNDAGRLLT